MKRILLLAALTGSLPGFAADTDALTEKARKQVQIADQILVKNLQSTTDSSGTLAAIKACTLNTSEIMTKLDKQWQISRTGLQVRNMENAANDWQRNVMIDFYSRVHAGEDINQLEASRVIDGEFQYMKAIGTDALCMSCHGTKLEGDVSSKLQKPACLPDFFNLIKTGFLLSAIKTEIWAN
ncbi:MAG: DUF3365 domain-containing protein [Reinekea sp.]